MIGSYLYNCYKRLAFNFQISHMRFLYYISIVIALIVPILGYLISVISGHSKIFLPMISVGGMLPPERYIFRLGIFVTVISYGVYSCFLYRVFTTQLQTSKKLCRLVNHLYLGFTIIALVAALGVAYFPAHSEFIAHIICANIFFIFIMLAVLMLILLLKFTKKIKSIWFDWRMILFILLMVCSLLILKSQEHVLRSGYFYHLLNLTSEQRLVAFFTGHETDYIAIIEWLQYYILVICLWYRHDEIKQ